MHPAATHSQLLRGNTQSGNSELNMNLIIQRDSDGESVPVQPSVRAENASEEFAKNQRSVFAVDLLDVLSYVTAEIPYGRSVMLMRWLSGVYSSIYSRTVFEYTRKLIKR